MRKGFNSGEYETFLREYLWGKALGGCQQVDLHMKVVCDCRLRFTCSHEWHSCHSGGKHRTIVYFHKSLFYFHLLHFTFIRIMTRCYQFRGCKYVFEFEHDKKL
jgi:hypothetical protein